MSLICSKSFAKTCDLIICLQSHPYSQMYKELTTKTPKRVFITGDNYIFERSLPLLTSFEEKYELVYHCSDTPFDRYKFETIRSFVSTIYAENCEISHPLIQRVPLGFVDDKIPRRVKMTRDILCYVNLGLYNDKEAKFVNCRAIRKRILAFFKTKPWAVVDETPIPFEEFNEKLNRSEFVVCPMGFGIDTTRFYESAWCGATPIITHSGLDEMHRVFKPLIVESYEDVDERLLTEQVRREPVPDVFRLDYWINDTPSEETKKSELLPKIPAV